MSHSWDPVIIFLTLTVQTMLRLLSPWIAWSKSIFEFLNFNKDVMGERQEIATADHLAQFRFRSQSFLSIKMDHIGETNSSSKSPVNPGTS